MKTKISKFINSDSKRVIVTKRIFTGILVISGALSAQNNYIPGLSPSPGKIGINLPSAPTEYNLQVGGSIGMSYGNVFGVSNTGWPAAQTRIFLTSWDATNGDYLAFYTPGAGGVQNTYEKLKIINNGNVGIGVVNPSARLHVNQTANPNGYATAGSLFSTGSSQTNIGLRSEAANGSYNIAGQFVCSGGSTQNIGVMISQNASGTPGNDWGIYCNARAYVNGVTISSDRKLKNNIKPLDNALEKIKLLKPSLYTYKTEEFKTMNLPEGEQMGLIAQDLEKVYPVAVSDVASVTYKNEKGELIKTPDFKGVNYISLIPVLIAGIQEQQAQLEAQRVTIADQNKANDALKNLVAMQQQQINDLINKTGGSTGLAGLNQPMDGFSMDQNVPNPFTNETVVKYTLPQSVTKANMVVYDLSGKQVASFALMQMGNSSITLNANNLAAGIYIYSIVADGKVMDSKRMVVAAKD